MSSSQNTLASPARRDGTRLPIPVAVLHEAVAPSSKHSGLEVLADVAEAHQHQSNALNTLSPLEIARVDHILRVANGHTTNSFAVLGDEDVNNHADTEVSTSLEHGTNVYQGASAYQHSRQMFDYGQGDILPYENEPADPNDHSRCTHGPITVANGYEFFCEMPRGCNHQWQKTNKESRKCISNFFGRNKRCTLAIRHPIVWCRSHYQTNAYQNENWRFQKMHLIDDQLQRIAHTDPGTLYTVTLKHSEATRLDNLIRGIAEPARAPRLHLRGTSFEAPLFILRYFENNFLGRNKSMEHCQSILEWTHNEMIAGRMTEIPHIEFLPQFPGIKLQLQDAQRRGLTRADNLPQHEPQEGDIDMDEASNPAPAEAEAAGDPDFDPEEAETDIDDSVALPCTPRRVTYAHTSTFRHARPRHARRQTIDATVGDSLHQAIEPTAEPTRRQTTSDVPMHTGHVSSSPANYDRFSSFGPDNVPTIGTFTAINKGKGKGKVIVEPELESVKKDEGKPVEEALRNTLMPHATYLCEVDDATRAASRSIDRAIAELQNVHTPAAINTTAALNLAQNILASPTVHTRAAPPTRAPRLPLVSARPQLPVINRPIPSVQDNGPPYLNRREMIARGVARRRLGDKGNVQKPFDKTSK